MTEHFTVVQVIHTEEVASYLPVGTVLFDADLDVIVRDVKGWRAWGDQSDFTEDAVICFPAMLIHRGGSEPWHARG